jgi:hypothetical protein
LKKCFENADRAAKEGRDTWDIVYTI